MAKSKNIPNSIKELTALALQDRILTLKEREVIVKAALKKGMSKTEINDYLNKALEERLKYYSKEELKRCPFCGAQIPLVSDECMFCGNSLQNTDTQSVPPPFVIGKEADIINTENTKTAYQLHDIKHCPDCGAPFPLISNICTHCGHVLHEQKVLDFNITNLINNIKSSIDNVKNNATVVFLEVLIYRLDILLLIFGATLLTLGIVANHSQILEAGIVIIVVTLILEVILFSFFRNSPVKIADETFYNNLNALSMYTRQVDTLYGKNKEAQHLLGELANQIDKLKQLRIKNRNKLTILIISILALPTMIYFLTVDTAKINDDISKEWAYGAIYANDISENGMTKNLLPLPEKCIAEHYSEHISIDQEYGMPSLRFEYLDDIFWLYVPEIPVNYSGKPFENITSAFHLALWDMDGNRVATDLDTITSSIDYLDNMMFNNNPGKYLIYFYDYTSITEKRMMEIIDSAFYFSIY